MLSTMKLHLISTMTSCRPRCNRSYMYNNLGRLRRKGVDEDQYHENDRERYEIS